MVECPKCGATIAARHLQPDAGVGQCAECSEIFALDSAALAAEAGAAGPATTTRPHGVTVEEQGGTLTIRIPWVRSRAVGVPIALGFFALATVQPSAGALLGPLGLLFGYFGLASLLNTTVVVASRSEVVATHGPIPWPEARVPRGPLQLLQVTTEPVRWSRHNRVAYFLGWPDQPVLTHYHEPEVPRFVRSALARYFVDQDLTT